MGGLALLRRTLVRAARNDQQRPGEASGLVCTLRARARYPVRGVRAARTVYSPSSIDEGAEAAALGIWAGKCQTVQPGLLGSGAMAEADGGVLIVSPVEAAGTLR